jgi:hypothetical protein
MALSLTLFTWDERVVQLELNSDSTVETLAALVEARRRCQRPPPRRRLAAASPLAGRAVPCA